MTSQDRLSYLESNENSHEHELSTLINPCKSLADVFNSVCEEEVETEQLKVYLRIRPLLSEENITCQDGNIETLNHKCILLTAPSSSHAFKTKPQGITKVAHRFTFTHVYGQETNQKLLYEDTTQDLVKDLVNGQNCLLFTYGATNSGKTYTIQGTNQSPGLLPRTLETLFKTVGEQQFPGNDLKPQHFCGVVRLSEKECLKEEEAKEALLKMGSNGKHSFSKSNCSIESGMSKMTDVDGASVASCSFDDSQISDAMSKSEVSPPDSIDPSTTFYGVFVSFAEIYNEYIYDLLERSSLSKAKKSPLVLGEDRHGAIYIKGLKEVRVKSAEEAMQMLEVGRQNLHFAATRLNHHSSRSHCIFTLKLIRLADPSYPHVARVSMLSLCDLAGAERTSKTLNSMDRLKEANNINTSLLVLGRCMTALRHNQLLSKQSCGPRKPVPIPYRDSKVTRLFQSFFMGKGKVAMIVNISMSSILFDETLKVLKFSALASKVSITQEKPPPIEQSVETSRCNTSHFSRFMRHSLNMSTASSNRLSVPWSNKSYADVTFGEGDDKDSSRMGAVLEEEDDEEDDRYEALLQLISKLKEKLVLECKEKMELETKLRKEICDAFSKRIVQIEDSWRSRLEDQRNRADEFMDWRMNHVLQSVKEKDTRKRRRPDSEQEEEEEEMVSSLHLFREELKVKELTDEKDHLEEELRALKSSLKATSQVAKNAQEENSKLVFQLAHNTRAMQRMSEEKEVLETSMRRNQSQIVNDTTDQLVMEELQLKIQSLEKCMLEKEKESKDLKDLLVEAAEEFASKEQLIKSLTSQVASSEGKVAGQAVQLEESEGQLGEVKDFLATRVALLEEREQEVYELQRQMEQIKLEREVSAENSDTEKLSQERQANELLRLEISRLRLDASSKQSALEDTQHKLDLESERNREMTLDLKDFEVEVDNLKAELEMRNQNLQERIASVSSQEETERLEAKVAQLEDKLDLAMDGILASEAKMAEMKEARTTSQTQMRQLVEANEHLERDFKGVNAEKELMAIKVAEYEVVLESEKDEVQRLEEEVKRLEGEVQKMKEGNALEGRLREQVKRLEGEVSQKLSEGSEEEKKLKEEVKRLEEEVKRLEGEVSQKMSEGSEEEERLKEESKRLEEELKRLEGEVLNKLKEGSEEEKKLKEEIERLEGEVVRNEGALEKVQIELRESFEANESVGKEVQDLRETLVLKEQQEQNLWKELGDVREEIDLLRKEKETTTGMEDELKTSKEMVERLTSEVEELKEELKCVEREKSEVELLEEKICGYKVELSEKENDLERVKKEKEELVEVKKGVYNRLESLENLVGTLESKNKALTLQMEVEGEGAKRLKLALREMEGTNADLEKDFEKAEQSKRKYEKEIQNLKSSLDEIFYLKDKVALAGQKEIDLVALNQSAKRQVQDLEVALSEKVGLTNKMSEKIENLDRKVTLAEDELEPVKSKCQMLEKEVAALREARKEEIPMLRAELDKKEELLSLKDDEIASLQQEIKRTLQLSVASESEKGKEKIKEEEAASEEMLALKEHLRMIENERSSLLLQVSSLQQELSHMQETSRSLQDSESFQNQSKSSARKGESESKTLGRKVRSTRSKRDAQYLSPNIEAVSFNSVPAQNCTQNDETSEMESATNETPAKPRPTRSTRGRKKGTQSSAAKSPTRKKNLTCRFDITDDSKDEMDDEEYEPEAKGKTAKKGTRTKSRRTASKVHNPHLENKENTRLSKEQESSETKPVSLRSRRRRPLYNLDVDEPFECSPNLIQLPPQEDSPHTVVRRKLRSKAK